MPTKRLERPNDPIALAKLIGDIATRTMRAIKGAKGKRLTYRQANQQKAA